MSDKIRDLTLQQKLAALALRFYQGAMWRPKAGDYYTSSRADLELYRVVKVESGKVFTEYCTRPGELAEWDEYGFTSDGFGLHRVHVPEFVLALAQQPATAVPEGITLERIERHAQPAGGCPSSSMVVLLSSIKRMLAAAPAAPVAQEPVAWRVSDPNEPEIGFWLSEEPGTSWHRSEPLYAAPPAAEQPDDYRWRAKSGLRYRDWQYGPMAKTAEGREGNPDIEIQALYLHSAAEQPGTVAVPRELLEELADIADAMQCYDARDDAIALLGKDGEA